MAIIRAKQKTKNGKICRSVTLEALTLTLSFPGLNPRLPSMKPASSRLRFSHD